MRKLISLLLILTLAASCAAAHALSLTLPALDDTRQEWLDRLLSHVELEAVACETGDAVLGKLTILVDGSGVLTLETRETDTEARLWLSCLPDRVWSAGDLASALTLLTGWSLPEAEATAASGETEEWTWQHDAASLNLDQLNESQLAMVQEEATQAVAGCLLKALVLLPEEDTLYLSADLAPEDWEAIRQAAITQ